MSTRRVNYEELPETSFEDMDTTFTKGFAPKRSAIDRTSPVRRHRNSIIPTPSSTTSSDGTIFSDNKGIYRLNSKTDEEGEEDEEDFLDDFQEFRSRKGDFDDAFQSYFKVQNERSADRKGSTVRNANLKVSDLAADFERKLNLDSSRLRRPQALRQPRSMMNLSTHSRHNNSNGAVRSSNGNSVPSSISTGDLRVKSNGAVRFKKSMPTLSNYNPIIEEEEEEAEDDEEDEEEEEGNEDDITFKRGNIYPTHDYLNHFMEIGEEENEDGFIFDESLIKPQFLSKTFEASPLKLSPSQYDIIRDDALLTPKLHKRHKDWNNRHQLDSFKERSKNNVRRKLTKTNSAASRIRIIKQEIDHNTPIKNGKMYYNPKTMKWEGNEQILDRFRKLESIDKKPLLIKTKSQPIDVASAGDYTNESKFKTEKSNLQPKKSFTNSKIVGKMMFDEDNLRWVSVHGSEGEEDPFAGIADVLPAGQASPNGTLKSRQHVSPFIRSQSQLLPSSQERSNSQGTTRYHSVGLTSNRDAEPNSINSTFQLNSKLLEKFCHEENRWNRKVSGWFIIGDKDPEKITLKERDKAHKHNNYMYEIRNMVISSTRS
ncbi:hypothetical protein HG535_0G00280 [Zygotorulaspora mrakii]|uniref:Uncharacterized protein n=1 Tax=Zygotorulaspora mrakii TaxID=42260 RepID=A0A7H9B6L3_ZYGMR|nr:uncharacterized protein HG535_0G00280 [Zygotorulaspora mrakii]QLG74143.1 hypothetical protein HG535_0G00280 [Zygotorulaspora mrakii]